jgi:hypothetical protein
MHGAFAQQIVLTALSEAWRQTEYGDNKLNILIRGAEFLFSTNYAEEPGVS